jgi:signal transduction histidine kinase/ActR/RegA family two-component response regulator
MSLKKKFFLAFTLFYVMSIVSVLVPTSYFLYQRIKQVIALDYRAQLNAIEYSLSNLFKEVENDLSILSNDATVRHRNDAAFSSFLNVENPQDYQYRITAEEQAIVDILAKYKNTHSYVSSVYMGRENGSFVRSHPRNAPTRYDPRSRPWYTTAKSNPGSIVRTEPYESVTINDVNIGTATALIDDNNKLFGVIGIDITLRGINDFIQKTSLAYQGSLEITDPQGIILASKDTKRLNTNEDSVFINKLKENNDNNFFAWHDEFIISYASSFLNWHMIGRIPKDAIYDVIFRIITNISIIAVAFYTLVCFTALFYFHKEIVSPIVKLKQAVEKAGASGELSALAADKRTDELGKLVVSFNQMATSINKHADHLMQLKKSAEAANNAKSIFLKNMGHEIRNPLNGMFGMAQLIEGTAMSEEQKRYVNILKKSILSLTGIVNDILEYTKIEAEMIEIETKPFILSEMVSEVVALHEVSAREKGLRMTVNIEPAVPSTVYGDKVRIRQVLSNLIGNAIKFTSQGSVSVEIRQDHREMDMVRLLFAVKDTGIGIPEDKHPLLFEKFFQLDSTFTKKFQGTGLGLSICKKLVELIGGRIWFVSEEGVGSTFCFHLPLKTDEKETASIETAAVTVKNSSLSERGKTNNDAQSKRNRRILIVDDDEINRFVLEEFLKRRGFDTISATNGEEALKIFKEQELDLILMDIQMPVLNGLEATKAIRALEKQQDLAIPIIGITGYAYKMDQKEFIAAGMNDCMPKPFEMNVLLSRIKGYLSLCPPDDGTQRPT